MTECVCGNYDDDDQVCIDCVGARMERRQSCFREIKMEYKTTRLYRIIAEDGDVVVLKEVKQGKQC